MTTTKDDQVLVDDDEINLENTNARPNKKFIAPCFGLKLEGFNIIILSVVIFSIATTIALIIGIFVAEPQVLPHGGVYSPYPICSDVGSSIIKTQGGNAVDATITTLLCLTLTRPDISSLFGCGSIMVNDRDLQSSRVFDFQCHTPYNYLNSNSTFNVTGVSSVVYTLYSLHTQWGSLSWSSYFDPIIKLIDSGFPIDNKVVSYAKVFKKSSSHTLSELSKITNSSSIYRPSPGIRDFYKIVSQFENPQQFYNNYGNKLILLMKNNSINWSSEYDNYSSKDYQVTPISFNGFKLHMFSPPYMGGLFTASTLNNLNKMFLQKRLDWDKLMNNDPVATAYYLNRISVLSRFAQSLASNSGDPSDPNIKDKVHRNTALLNDDKFNEELINLVPDDQILVSSNHYDTFDKLPPKVLDETVNLGDGFILSTDSVRFTVLTSFYMGSPFGVGEEFETTGQFLNAALSLFSPSSKSVDNMNVIAPGRRPLVPAGPVYLHSNSKKCGIRFGIGSSGGFWGLFDSLQVISDAVFFLDGSQCTSQEATPPAPTLVIPANSADTSKSSQLAGTSCSSLNLNCLPAYTALKNARVHVAMTFINGSSKGVLSQFVEASMPKQLSNALTKLKWNYSTVPENQWNGRVAIAGWNGYNLIAYGDPRDSDMTMKPF